jgi:hypothetical protein
LGSIVNILLWDRECYQEEEVLTNCSGTPYHISGTGCVQVLEIEWGDSGYDLLLRDDFGGGGGEICHPYQNIHYIRAKKLCECDSTCGTTPGSPPVPGEVRSVSLIQ